MRGVESPLPVGEGQGVRLLDRLVRSSIAALLLLLVVSASAAAQEPTGPGLRPGGDHAARGYFVLEASPGNPATAELLVVNGGTSPATLDLYRVDAATAAATGASYGNRGEPLAAAGAWLRLPEARLELPPNATARVPFEVNVPAGARAGQHLAGIAAQAAPDASPATPLPTPGSTEGRFRMTTLTRSVVAVAVTVPGPLERRLTATDLRAVAGPSGPQLSVRVRNEGNVLLKPRGAVVIHDDAGSERARVPIEMDTILPGSTALFAAPWPNGVPPGDYRADLELLADDVLPSAGIGAPLRVESRDQPVRLAAPRSDVARAGLIAQPGVTRLGTPASAWPWWAPYAAGLLALVIAGNVVLALTVLRQRPRTPTP